MSSIYYYVLVYSRVDKIKWWQYVTICIISGSHDLFLPHRHIGKWRGCWVQGRRLSSQWPQFKIVLYRYFKLKKWSFPKPNQMVLCLNVTILWEVLSQHQTENVTQRKRNVTTERNVKFECRRTWFVEKYIANVLVIGLWYNREMNPTAVGEKYSSQLPHHCVPSSRSFALLLWPKTLSQS